MGLSEAARALSTAGSPAEVEERRGAVEAALSGRLMDAVTTAVEAVVSEASAAGLVLRADPLLPLEFVTEPPLPALRVTVHAVMGVSVRPDRPAPAADGHDVARFYELASAAAAAAEARGFPSLGRRPRMVLVLYDLQREVENGGFSQYLLNSASAHADEALQALRTIGATETLALLERALDLVPPALRGDRDASGKTVARLSDVKTRKLEALDHGFYALDEDVAHLFLRWDETAPTTSKRKSKTRR